MSSRERDEDRGSRRSRDEDEPRSRRSRDEDDSPRRSRRDEDEPRSRGRDDDERPTRRSRDDDDDRGSRSSGSGAGYRYESRDPEATKRRAQRGNTDFDKYLASNIKQYKVNDGDNRLRILPPTWSKPEHYAFDIYLHYGIGADKQSYLCPLKMKDEPCPICEERALARDDGDEDYAKQLEPKRRALMYVVDREKPRDGVQAWSAPWTVDNDIVKVSQDKSTGEVLAVDHPEDGFDVEFERTGTGLKTKYEGVAVARRSSPLGKAEWLDFALDNPIDKQLVFFSYEEIAKSFGKKGGSGGRDRDDDRRRDRDEPRGRSRDDDDRGSRDRDRDDDRSSRSRDEPRGRGKDRNDDPVKPTWSSVHDMTKSELEDLIESEDLDINPKDAKDVDDLADWVCEEMKLKKAEPKAEGGGRTRRREEDDEADDKLKEMRQGRSRDDDEDRPRSRSRDEDEDKPRRRRED